MRAGCDGGWMTMCLPYNDGVATKERKVSEMGEYCYACMNDVHHVRCAPVRLWRVVAQLQQQANETVDLTGCDIARFDIVPLHH
jgi:hypothetical protein